MRSGASGPLSRAAENVAISRLGRGSSCCLPGQGRRDKLASVNRHVLWLILLTTACTDSSRSATANPGEEASDAATHQANTRGASSTALEASIVRTATSAKDVARLKLRLDAQGAVVKQALYHGDRTVIPEAVLALAERTHPGAKAVHYESEIYADLGEVFEVEVETSDGRRCEVASRPDGTLLYEECQLDPGELPPPVAQASASAFPGAEILEAEHKKTADGTETYSVELKHDGREYYLILSADGTISQRLLRVPALVEIPI
jgi:uncharacterized membrane protein YkoI